jgi:hypothetical protein
MQPMSIDIASVGRTPTPPVSATPVGAPPAVAASRHQADPVTVDTIPATPPPEVHQAMGVAAKAYASLQASGREMRFKVNEATGKLTVEIHDTHGNLLFSVPASKALEVAAGGSLD